MSSKNVTIIAYHALEAGPGPICIAPSVFESHVRAMHAAGCTALTVTEVAEHLRTGTPFPDRAVALTFDDGYASVHRCGLTLLDSLGYRATVFPVTSQIGGHNRWDHDAPWAGLALLHGSQIRELVSAGWEVGGHTHTHSALPGMDRARVVNELETSTAILEDLCGRPVRTFAFPFGRHDAASRLVAGDHHDACLGIGATKARLGDRLDRLQRVDAWYLRRTWQVRVLHGRSGDAYLAARRAARGFGGRLARGS